MLQAEATPRLEILLGTDTKHIVQGFMTIGQNDGSNRQIKGTLVRITVRNKSSNKSVQDVRCVIPQIEGWAHAFTNQKLQPLAAGPSFQLAAGGRQVVGVLFVPDDEAIGEVFILYDDRLTIGRGLPRRDHRIMVQAQGLDVASAGKWLVLRLAADVIASLEDLNGSR